MKNFVTIILLRNVYININGRTFYYIIYVDIKLLHIIININININFIYKINLKNKTLYM